MNIKDIVTMKDAEALEFLQKWNDEVRNNFMYYAASEKLTENDKVMMEMHNQRLIIIQNIEHAILGVGKFKMGQEISK